ncbi:outer membrane protein [Gymnodinialimonas hymeniacidonis]|uniref:outer membrane protein n=1 Tax=Gymnodinialimonas hymeniacidonis TaxID=3126508 RepID=UPI0034C5EF29
MMRFSLTTLALLTSTGAAFAGPYDAPAAPPPVIIAEERGFDGFYAGLEYGLVDSEFSATLAGANVFTVRYPQEGDAWGGFAGYNFQNGGFVYGGEVRMLHFIDADTISTRLEDVIDLRARAGYALGDDVLVYAAAGYSTGNYWFAGVDTTVSGLNFGAGAEFNVTDRLFVGFDYTSRELEMDPAVPRLEGPLNTATLRVGFRF